MKSLIRSLALTAICGALGACATAIKQDVKDEVESARKGPEVAPQRNITNFSAGLRCMDNLMIRYGVRDLSVLVEDLEDNTEKVKAGTKDMLITAVSDMTKRSRAIKLVAFGNDSGNLVSYIAASGNQSVYNVVPQYDIRGSISQLDTSVARKQADAGIGIDKFGAGYSTSAAGSVLGLDLSILRTDDLSVVPGVHSRNSVVILKSGSAVDADASIRKAGINFSMFFSKDEGQTQALRNLVELAVIELFGKLTKVPYWSCLGIDPEHEDMKNEQADWYYAMARHGELVPYMQYQLRLRGFYQGPLDGAVSEELKQALIAYRAGLDMKPVSSLDLAFFKAFLNQPAPKPEEALAKLEQAQSPAEAAAAKQAMPATASEAKTKAKAEAKQAHKTAVLRVRAADERDHFAPGERVNLVIETRKDGYLYCFYLDDARKIQRFYPNRFQRDPFVRAGSAVVIPGGAPFKITASTSGAKETVACFSAPTDVFQDLPEALRLADFEDLEVASLGAVEEAFKQAADDAVSVDYYNITTK